MASTEELLSSSSNTSEDELESILLLQQHLDGYADENEEEEVHPAPSNNSYSAVPAVKSPVRAIKPKTHESEEISLDALLGKDYADAEDKTSANQRQNSNSSLTKISSTSTSPLPSAETALSQSVLTFKEYADSGAIAKETHEVYNHVRASAHPAMAGKDNEVESTPLGLPTIGWHVPLTTIDIKKKSESPLPKQGDMKTYAEPPSKRTGMTVKEKEKLKRFKGQSTHDSWKPEEWMKMRQSYD